MITFGAGFLAAAFFGGCFLAACFACCVVRPPCDFARLALEAAVAVGLVGVLLFADFGFNAEVGFAFLTWTAVGFAIF